MSEARGRGSPGGGLHALATVFRIGAIYDWAFAALMLAAPGLLERLFALPLPSEIFYLRLIAVLLVILGAIYWVVASDPGAHRTMVWIATLGRSAGFVVMAHAAFGRPEIAGLWAPALGDLAFALAQLASGRRLLLR